MDTLRLVCTECGKAYTMVFTREPTFSELKKTICPACGQPQSLILKANRTFTRSPENRAKQSAVIKAAWAAHKAILARAQAAGSGVDPTNELHADFGAKTATYRHLVQMLRRINLDSGKLAREWIRLLAFDPWGAHSALVTPAVLQYAFGGSVESAMLCQRLFRVRVNVEIQEGEQP